MKIASNTLKRLIAVMLTLALVFGSASDLLAGFARSVAVSEGEGSSSGGSGDPASGTNLAEYYTITWLDWDGYVLSTNRVAPNTTPEYNGSTPSRPATETKKYTFTGWSPAIAAATANATYTAQYTEEAQPVDLPTYTITWKDKDGTVLKTETVLQDTVPDFGDPPVKEDVQKVYTFTGWNPNPVGATANAEYTAQYDITARKYKVTFVNYDGTVVKEATEYDYGTAADAIVKPDNPTRPDEGDKKYIFKGWSPEIAEVTADVTYTAVYRNPLQQVIADKIAQSDLKERITVILNKNTQYEGDIAIEKESGKTYGENFGIDLVAEDAGEDGLQADGTANIIGAMTIKGINVLLKGITVSGKVAVEGANVDYYGTKSDERLEVAMDAASNVNIQTGEGADTVTATQAGGTLNIDTGAGNDTVTATQNGGTLTIDTDGDDDKVDITQKANTGSTATVDTGDGLDTVTAKTDAANGGAMTISTGAGEDTVTAEHANGTMSIDTGDDGDKVTVTSSGNLDISTGDGNDAVALNVSSAAGGVNVQTGAGNDSVSITGSSGTVTNNAITVDMGSGINEAAIDIAAANAVKQISIISKDGNDHLHITGTLAPLSGEGSVASNASGTKESMKLTNSGKKEITITTSDLESITDDLANKRTVYLTPTVKADGTLSDMTYEHAISFTNYIITAPASTLGKIKVRPESGQDAVLSNVIINTDTSGNTSAGHALKANKDHELAIKAGSEIDTLGLSLVLQAKNITVDGTLKADQITIEAKDGTGVYSPGFSDTFAAYHEGENMNVFEAGARTLADMAWDLVNINDKASIIIGKDAVIQSKGDVILTAAVEQSGSLISGLTDTDLPINVVNVKIADAIIDIQGKIYAGYDFTTNKTRSDFGSVRASATVKTTMGYDEKGHMQDGYPLAVNVGTVNANINVAEGAEIQAAKDISLAVKSELKAATRADSGKFSAPAAVAVAVLLNNASATVNGTLTANAGSVSVTSDASTDAKTLADKNEGHDSKSGGFAAVSVVLQESLAEVGETGKITAAGSVSVKSSAVEKVENTATSAQQKSEEEEDNSLGGKAIDSVKSLLVDKVFPKIKDKITEPSAQEKLEAALKKVGSGTHSAQLDEDAQQKGEVTIGEEKQDGKVTYTATVKPWTGYKVKSVTWRGYNPGDSKYTTGTATLKEANKYEFTASVSNVFISVEYEEDEDYDEPNVADLFDEDKQDSDDDVDLQKLVDDLNASTDDGGKSIDELIDEIEEATNIMLDLNKSNIANGAILTYDREANGEDCLKKVAKGDKIRFLPNPAANYKLKDGSLKVVYYVKGEDDKSIQKTVALSADAKGRYYFTVPEDILEERGILLKAEFVATGESDEKADETSTAVVGAIGVVVANNDSQAIIRSGATVIAGKKAEVLSTASTTVANKADGSPVNEKKGDGDKKEEKKEGEAVKRPASQDISIADPNNKNVYGLVIDETINGKVSAAKEGTKPDDKTYQYKLTIDSKADGYDVAKVLLIFYSGGERKTKELTAGADGKYLVDLTADLREPNGEKEVRMDEGSTARISVTFAKEGEYGKAVEGAGKEQQVILANPIRISYNVLKDDTNMTNNPGYAGYFYYKERKTETDPVDSKAHTYYVFKADAISSKGFIVKDGGVTASWKDATGAAKTAKLERRSDGLWYLKADDIPVGVEITVNCKFEDDFHDFKVDSNASKNGTITLFDKQVKKGETPQIVVKPNSGYTVDKVTITYTKVGTSGFTGTKEASGFEGSNLWKVTIPNDVAAGSPITVTATYNMKKVGINYTGDESAQKKIFTLSDRQAAKKDTVTVTLTADEIKKGNRIKSITVTGTPAITATVSGTKGTFKIPDGAADETVYTVAIETEAMPITLSEVKLDNGTITPATAKTDWNETVTVTVKPKDDFKVKSGSMKAVVKAGDGSFSEEIAMSRKDDKTYTFTMPAKGENQSYDSITVTLTGEFEPGQGDSSALETSLGAAIAVTVANSESRGEIKGSVSAGSDVNVNSDMKGGATTSSKAGYSKGNIGIGGAVSVQVASLDSKALIHKGATVKLDGNLNVQATSDLTFGTSADASGSKEAKKVGVGAGIAVAVDGADAFAAVSDDAVLSNKTDGKNINGISVVANQKVKDTVSAKAGAAGGTAAVPVAAVDVVGVRSEAYLGKANSTQLKVTEGVSVSAVTSGDHTITADATATGKGVGVGAAITVSVIFDNASAKLKQSVDAASVAVSSETTSKVVETATASASGGKKEGESKSPDKQADGLLGGAANLAGKNNSSTMDGSKISSATKDRQKAETGEGTVGVAGAVAVNVQFSESRAEVLDGVNIKSAGAVSVTSLSGTTAKVKANASTTNSDIGVGVGAAVNIIFLNNIASIGDGEIEAAMLKVAAATKMTPPEADTEKATEKKVETKDELAQQLGGKVKEFVTDLAKEIGLSDYVAENVLGKILGEVVTETTNQLIKDTGINDLVGAGDLAAKYETAKKKLLDAKDGLLALPEQIFDPLFAVIKDCIEIDNALDMKALKTNFITAFKNQVMAHGESVLKEVKDGVIEYLKDNMTDILSGLLFEGNGKNQIDDMYAKAKNALTNILKGEFKSLLTDTIVETLQRSGISAENINRAVSAFKDVKDAYKKESLDTIITKATQSVTETFRTNVFDYEAVISKIAKTDFKKTITTTLKNAAKKAAVTLTNGAISALAEGLDVQLAPKEKQATGHVIDTQAIAGAGTRDVGVAGSVAVTVLNSETSATIAEGGTLKIAQDATVAADETRNVHSVASAALDANGNASANKKADKEGNKDVGGGNDAGTKVTWSHVSMETATGASLNILEGDKVSGKPRIYITLQEGYKFPVKDGKEYAEYTYTNKEGFEVIGTLTLSKTSDGKWFANPAGGDLANLDDDVDIHLSLKPEEVLNNIAKPGVLAETGVAKDEDVTIKVKDRKQEEGKTVARAGETVEIHIARNNERKITGVGYSYKDKDGNTHDVEFEKADKKNAFVLATVNDKEIVYSFNMPDGEITDVVVMFEKGEEDKTAGDSKTKAKDDTGKGVGVGAAFSMVYGDNTVKATIGKRTITAGELSVTTASSHKEDIAATAGSDPMSGTDESAMKQTSIDASVALNLLDNELRSGIAAGSTVTTTGYTVGEGSDAVTKDGDLTVTATENSVTETTSSAFAVGGATAVGATASINIADTDMAVEMQGTATVAGSAVITANSHSEDTTRAMATAMGADIARNLNKLNKATSSIEDGGNKLLDGSYVDKAGADDNNKNKTQTKINKKLESKTDKSNADADKTGSNTSTSTNALRAMGVKAESGDSANQGTEDSDVTKNLDKYGGKDLNLGGGDKENKDNKWQVAAAVGVTVASHSASVTVGKITAGKAITVGAENTGNFNTMGTGAAMSLAEHANSIAAGVAVSVNSNKAVVKANDDLIANGGDLSVTSKLTQNLDGDFAGKLAVQSLSGSAAGKDSSVSIGGAISVLVSQAETSVEIAGGTDSAKRTLTGENITVEATDKSRLGVRAGGLSLSKGSSVGMGIASSTLVSNNTVSAEVGDYTTVTGSSFKLNAEKQAVTAEDFKNLIDLRYVITDSSKLSEEQRKNANTGLIDVHKGDDDENYKVKINLTSDKLLAAVDGLNFLSGQNTYVEAIAGSIMTGSSKEGSKLSLAGSFAVAVTNNKINARLGKNANVTLTRKDQDHDGSMTVNASNGTTSRIIAGSMSAAPAQASVGATIAVLVANDTVKAETGTDAAVSADGDVTHSASTSSDIQVFTAAMSVAAGEKAKVAAGGAINVIVSNNKAENVIGNGLNIAKAGSVSFTSNTKQDLWALSGSANISAGTNAEYAAGGTVNVIVDNSKSLNTLGSMTVNATGNVNAAADVSDQLISGVASLSVAASTKGKSGAGVVNVIVSKSSAKTDFTGKADITSTNGDISIGANNDAWMLNAGLALAGSMKSAVGAAFNINVFKREATVKMTEGTLNAGQDINVQASGRDTGILAGLSVSGSVQGNALSGNIIVGVESNTIGTEISKGITATAGRNALVDTYFSDYTIGVGGNIGISGSGKAVGASILTVVKNNDITTAMGASTVTANAAGDVKTKTLTGREIKGVYVGAEAQETQFFGAAGVAVSGSDTAANGEVVVLVNNNTVSADASAATLNAKKNKGSIMVNARDITKQTLLAGGISFSGSSSALGAAVVTLVSNKTVDAKAHNMHAYQNIDVLAENNDDISQLAVSAGGSGSGNAVQIGASVQVLKSRARATVASEVTADYGNFNLKALNNTKLINVAGAVAATGGNIAVTPVGAITYFQGEADARLKEGTTVKVTRGNMVIGTESNKDVTLITAGISASTGFGLSGAANILVSKDKAYSGAEAGTSLDVSSGNLDITTDNNYKLRAISGAIGLGKAAVGVNAVVSIMKSSAIADLGGNTTVGRTLNVKATANRDVINAAATLAAGQFGGGITVMVLVAGSKMSQDAADMIAYGNSDSREKKEGFDASLFMNSAKTAGIDFSAINADEGDEDRQLNADILAKDLEGNGHYESKETVGSKQDDQVTFDGASGYRADDLDTLDNDSVQDSNVKNRGESLEAKDTKDITAAKNMNTYTYEDDPDDAVIARIRAGIDVDANAVNVIAAQGSAVDMIGAAIGVGQAGMGISTVVAILRTNVSASSMAHIKSAAAGVTVKAESKAGKFVGDHDAEDRNEAVGDLLSNKPVDEDASEADKKKAENEKKSTLEELGDKLSNRSLRAFSLAVGAGQIGLGVAVSVILTDNVTQAILGGTVENAGDVNVSAKHDYGSVMAATGSLAVGQFAAGASVSVAQANGTVKAIIADDATVKTNEGKDITITTQSGVNVDSIAVTAGGGMGALNAAVALSFNRLKQETGIGSGTTIESGRNITVTSTSATKANNYLLGVSVGGVGISLNAAVADVSAEIDTHIGKTDKESTITAKGDIKVSNDTVSAAIPKVLAIAAGGVAVGGNVLLAFNNTKNFAEVNNATVTARNLTVIGDLAGEATSSLASLTVGGIAVGLSVNYADMRANNQASVNDSALTLTGDLNIKTGVGDHKTTSASADTIAANMGLITVGVNAAIARNNAKNYAILHTTKAISVDGAVNIHGAGDSSATASIRGLDIGAAAVAVSAVVALNDADARTDVETKDITVGGKLTLDGTQKASTNAKMKTGGGSLLSLKVSAAVAYGKASSMVKGEFGGKAVLKGGYSTTNTAEDDVTADIQNQSFDLISAAARFAGAYSQDLYTTNIAFRGSSTEITGNVDILNTFTVTTTAGVTPSASGVDVGLGSIAVNAAVAKNTAKSNAAFEATHGNAHVTGNVNVQAVATVSTDAEVRTAKISVKAADLGANIANADMSATQEAHLRVGGVLTVDGDVNVQSVANSAKANAVIATVGGDDGVKLGLANLDISRAIARENFTSSATVVGGPVAKAKDVMKIDRGEYVTEPVGRYDYDFVVDGKYTVRDENGVVQKEQVRVVRWNTGEYEIYNAENTLIESTLKEANAKKRTKFTETFRQGDKVRFGEHFEWITEEVTYWKKNIVDEEYDVDIYNPDENKLTAANLTIFTGTKDNTKTGATASTRGPVSVGVITAGSLDAKAYSVDSFGIVFEGMTARIAGKASLKVSTDTVADAKGATPGGFSVVDIASSDVTAQVGKRDDRQTVSILIGKGNALIAGNIDIITENAGSATAWLDQGTKLALATISKSSQPTESWYNTLVTIGRGATLRATNGDINIVSTDAPKATSKVNTTNYSLTLNFNTMSGINSIDQESNIDIGASADVAATGNVNIRTGQHTIAEAQTVMNGGGVLFDGSSAVSRNTIYRVARVNVGEDAVIQAGVTFNDDGTRSVNGTGTLTLHAQSGENDNIYAESKVGSKGLVSIGNAKAYNDVESHAELIIAQGAKLTSGGKMSLLSTTTSFNPDIALYKAGIRAIAVVDCGGLIPAPNTVAKNNLEFVSYIGINERPKNAAKVAQRKAEMTSEKGDILVNASNERISLYAYAKSSGKGGGGTSNANAWNAANLENAVKIDDATFTANNISVYADNGGSLKNSDDFQRASIVSDSFAELLVLAGKLKADSRITGRMVNQIRSNDVKSVTWNARNGGKVIHKAASPKEAITMKATTDYERIEVLGISLTKADEVSVIKWGYFNRCDFCGEGTQYDVDRTKQISLDKRYDDAFEKILAPISDIQQAIANRGAITKARYSEEENTQASKIYVLDLQSMLRRDVRMDPANFSKYKLWTNSRTFLNVYLMPNATRIYTNASNKLQYVVDLIGGDLFGDGNVLNIEIISALTSYAAANPTIPVGSTGSLNLLNGTLYLPELADYELYLNEISGAWLLDQMNSETFRTLVGDQEEINTCALEGADIPDGTIISTLTEGEEADGWKQYWIGDTPETAADPDQNLLLIRYNPETDEADVVRTTASAIANGEAPQDLSLFIYRDSKADRMGDEKYNVMLFDTPEEEKSLVKVVTNVLFDRTLEVPQSLNVILRGRTVEGADHPVYTLTDHAIILCDATDGEVDILGGYHATFDGDVFDSNYTRVEGIRDGNIVTTIKRDQPVWPEWTGESSAEDGQGDQFRLVDDVWEKLPEDEDVTAEDDFSPAA